MDNELKQYLIEMEVRLGARFDQIDSRFGQIDTRFGQIDAHFGEIGTRFGQIDTRLEEMEARLIERMRDMQTELLKAFGPWQEIV